MKRITTLVTHVRSRRWARRALYAAGGLGLLLVVAVGLASAFVRIPKSGSRQTVLFYAAPTELSPGRRLDEEDLRDRLRRLGYRPTEADPAPGQFRESSQGLEIHLRPFRYPGREFPGGRVVIVLSGDRVSSAVALDDLQATDYRLEPERIAGFEGETAALLDYLRLEDAPPLLVEAILTVEDRRFLGHLGVDLIGTGRALLTNLRRGERAQGGSTLTQQLARSLYLQNRKSLLRKAEEAVLAVGLELRYSKREILEGYLNAVYWGQWGAFEIRGAQEASRYYLGQDLESVDAAGCALLAGLIQAPNLYSPYADPDRARNRRDVVLRMLQERGVLSEDECAAALKKPLPAKRPPHRPAEASYFLDAARRELERRTSPGTLGRAGVSVFTTLDLSEQRVLVAGLREGVAALERDYRSLRRAKEPLEGAAIVVEVGTGEVRALVGGRNILRSSFNRATEARRQPGSLMKPFVYLAAFRHPERDDGSYWTPATLVPDEPLELRAGRNVWKPQNYDHEFRGDVTVRRALEQSLNVPTARVGFEIGLGRVAQAARDLGIESPLEEVPSLALGTSEVTLVEITQAYAALAGGGVARAPTLLRGCVGPQGEAIPLDSLEDPDGVEPEAAYLVTHLLEGVIDAGTGHAARNYGVRGVVAGKTGTTDDYRDAWFVGFDTHRALGVWVGFDRAKGVGLSGAVAALPIWARIFRDLQDGALEDAFPRPDGVVTRIICPYSGGLARYECPDVLGEVFQQGTQPVEECEVHDRNFFRRMRRFFRI